MTPFNLNALKEMSEKILSTSDSRLYHKSIEYKLDKYLGGHVHITKHITVYGHEVIRKIESMQN